MESSGAIWGAVGESRKHSGHGGHKRVNSREEEGAQVWPERQWNGPLPTGMVVTLLKVSFIEKVWEVDLVISAGFMLVLLFRRTVPSFR